MDRAEIRALVRSYLNDPAPGQRWTDAELDLWINLGLEEWTQDANQLEVTATPSQVAPSSPFYVAPATFQAITRVQWQGRELPQMLLPEYQTWEVQQGQPAAIILGPYGPNKFRLFPFLTADQSPLLTVYGTAFAAGMTADTDVPGIPAAYHKALAYYATSEAYMKDSDDSAVALADRWRGRYDAQVRVAQQQQPVMPGWVPMRYP